MPKGSKLAQGYTDRTTAREDEDKDERAVRLKALEESLKKEEIDQETYDNLRARIAGGDLESTHLVKGLDFKLLERIRKGEDVYGNRKPHEEEEDGKNEDLDDALDQLEDIDVQTIARLASTKKGQLATSTILNPGQKRSRAMILAEMKAAREAAKAKEESSLSSRFKKIGDKTPGSRIERDSKGREVLIIVDEDGNEKRKVRKVQTEQGAEEEARARDLLMPDKNAKPLGMEVPEIYRKKVEEVDHDNMDIFDDIGDDYDPLAGLDEDSDDEEDTGKLVKSPKEKDESNDHKAMPLPSKTVHPVGPRNYFKDAKTELASSQTLQAPSMSDPAIQAAFRKAAALNFKPSEEKDEQTRAREERHKRMLESVDRDAEDMDMGFGTSRFEDEADFDESKIKLSRWDGGEEDVGEGAGSKAKRKRGGKKRKGDANNVDDIMRVIEQRKAGK
jgi:hypothetical protein